LKLKRSHMTDDLRSSVNYTRSHVCEHNPYKAHKRRPCGRHKHAKLKQNTGNNTTTKRTGDAPKSTPQTHRCRPAQRNTLDATTSIYAQIHTSQANPKAHT